MMRQNSDFVKFGKTMWIMLKHDVLPWVALLSVAALIDAGFVKAEKGKENTNKNIEFFKNNNVIEKNR